MPGQTNALGSVFGGEVMSWIDICAAISAQRFARCSVVTAMMDGLRFKAPIREGQVAVLVSQVNWAGKTSMEVGVRVEGEDPRTGNRYHTATAYLTFVAVDDNGRPTAIPELVCESDLETRRWEEAKVRRELRIQSRASS